MRAHHIIALFIAGSALFAGAANGKTGSPDLLRDRLARDTVYYAVVDLNQLRVHVSYGSFPLVDCGWRTDALLVSEVRYQAASNGPLTVTDRRVWYGHAAVPARVVRTVAQTTSASPEQVARVMPERFEIALSGGVTLRIMTERGSHTQLRFGEKWRRWIRKVCPACGPDIITMIVSPEDAQTLYYALEPGTPVIIHAGND